MWRSTRRRLSLRGRTPSLDQTTAPQSSSSRSKETSNDVRAVLRTRVGDCYVSVSTSDVQARLPCADFPVVKVQDDDHVFVAIFTAAESAPGLSYLRVKLHQQMRAHLRLQKDAIAAVTASFASIAAAYKRLHPLHGDVMEGVQLTFVFLDVATMTVYLASSGHCQAAACSLQEGRAVLVSAPNHELDSPAVQDNTIHVQTLPLDHRLDGIVLGSAGLWQELTPAKALLRLQLLAQEAPSASGCNPAAHLNNFALHAVTQRMRNLSDPRMRALSSAAALQSLWVGSRANFSPEHERVPLRRCRGDVFGDLTAVVVRLGWSGRHGLKGITSGCRLAKTTSAMLMGHPSSTPSRPTAAARWALLRMHFCSFPAAARHLTLQKWHDTIAAARHADAQSKLKARVTESLVQDSHAQASLPGAAAEAQGSLWRAFVQIMPA